MYGSSFIIGFTNEYKDYMASCIAEDQQFFRDECQKLEEKLQIKFFKEVKHRYRIYSEPNYNEYTKELDACKNELRANIQEKYNNADIKLPYFYG